MQKSSLKEPTGKLVEIEGIEYLLVDGKLYRYADMTLDKGFKIVLGRPGSEEILKKFIESFVGNKDSCPGVSLQRVSWYD